MLTPHICPHLRDITQLTPYINTLMSSGKTHSDWMKYWQNCILSISVSKNAFPLLCSSHLRHVTAIAIFKTQQIWIEVSCQTVRKQIFSQYSECIFITYHLRSPTEFSPHLPHLIKMTPVGFLLCRRWSVLNESGVCGEGFGLVDHWVRVLWCLSVDIISPWLLLKTSFIWCRRDVLTFLAHHASFCSLPWVHLMGTSVSS